jgi:lipopolysaccharide transport system ATP-binding protein
VRGDSLITVDGVSKKFTRTLRRSMLYGLWDIGMDVAGLRQRSERLRPDEFWAVRDVSFALKRGDVLGIIGANGSGKTTMLAMLNGIIGPDTGRIAVTGRVGALIQLGAGFHPMLNGRENIYINGAVLGMSRAEIDRQFDSIVEFSGMAENLDTPVKYYSSGMYVRLGFSIAVHMQPDVLLVDEVLAVGDASFRARAMDRMWELVTNGNTAVVFVSHNMLAVDGFCNRILLLEKGRAHTGSKAELIARYHGDEMSLRWENVDPEARRLFLARGNQAALGATGDIELVSVKLMNEDGVESESFGPDDTLRVRARIRARKQLDRVVSSIGIRDPSGLVVSIERSVYHDLEPFSIDGERVLEIVVDPLQLKGGAYVLNLSFQDPTLRSVYCAQLTDVFRVVESMPNPGGKEGFFRPNLTWRFLD